MSKRTRDTEAARDANRTRASVVSGPEPTRRRNSSSHATDDHSRLVQRALGNDALGRLLATVNVQAKLRVSQINDASEREADRVAAFVMSMEIPKNGDVTPPRIIRRPVARSDEVGLDDGLARTGECAEIERELASLMGGGRPLPTPVREFFERRFGADLADVRIHTDRLAADTARSLGARAFTHGTHIAFDRGEYAPGSVSGKRLLAHEIAHTRQHQLPGSTASGSLNIVQRRKTPPEPDTETDPEAIAERLPDYRSTRDIQWHIDPVEILKTDAAVQLYLLISVRRIARRETVSAPKIAVAAVDTLVGNTALELNENQYHAFVSYITAKLNTRGFETSQYFLTGVSEFAIKKFFTPESYRQITREARADWSGEDEIQTRLTDNDYYDLERMEAEEQEKARRQEAWAESKEKKIRRMIEKARNQKPRPLDLPDKVSARKGRRRWHLRVWVNYDLRKKTKNRATGLVRLRTNESDAALFARVRAATARAMILEEYAEKAKREKEFPQWAKDKKKAIQQELVRQRHEPANRHKKNFPDGMVLVAEEQARGPKPKTDPNAEGEPSGPGHALHQRAEAQVNTSTPGTAQPLPTSKAAVGLPPTTGVQAPAYIYLHVWVERGTGKAYQRKGGNVPVPLTPQTNVNEVAGYIRKLTAVFRQYEEPALDNPKPPIEAPKELSDEVTLRAFPALLKPKDLSPTQISVSGARNEFSMQLDYQDVYERHRREGTDLFVASKLYSQRIHFFWKVFPLTAALRREMPGELPTEWPQRWLELYRFLNATDKPYPEERWKNEALFNGVESVDHGGSRKSSRRVKFPSMEEGEPSKDYIVFCHTGHAPIKSAGETVQRVASVAYYPVRIKPIKTVAKGAVTRRADEIKLVRRDIEQFQGQLENDELSELHRDVLEAMLKLSEDHLTRLQMLESGFPGQGIRAELAFIRDTLPKLDLIDAARSKARLQRTAPSKFLEDRPDLLAIHFYLISKKMFVYEYRQELEAKREQFQRNAAVARTFRNDLKKGSPFQFTAEGTMVSTLTGRIYPLTLMIGEAPDRKKRAYRRQKRAEARLSGKRRLFSPKGGDDVAYTVVDITSPQTQDKHYGYDRSGGSTGHLRAIQDALNNYGDEATYGEGLIAVRIPAAVVSRADNPDQEPGPVTDSAAKHRQGPTLTAESAPGPLQRVMKFLAILAALAGAAALAATGVGAPAAAAAIGLVASILGAAAAVHNINRRANRRTLAWDAELALDVISIIGVLPAGAGARLAKLGNLPKGVAAIQRTQNFLRIYSTLEAGATVTLVSQKLVEDIRKIEALADRMKLSKQEKQKMIDQAIGGALQTGMMMLGGVVASRSGQTATQRRMARADRYRLERHAEMAEAEGLLRYESKVEPLLDAHNNPTPAGLKLLGQVAPHAVPKRTSAAGRRKGPIDPNFRAPRQAQRKGGRPRRPAPDEVDESAKTGRYRRGGQDAELDARRRTGAEEPEEGITEQDRQKVWELEDLGEAAVARLTRPEKITSRYHFEARRAFHDTWMNAKRKEIGLYRNSETGEYIIVVGKEDAVYVQKVDGQLVPPIGKIEQRWKKLLDEGEDVGEWLVVAHSHPTGVNGTLPDRARIPSGASGDFAALIFESQALGGAPRTSHIYFKTGGKTENGMHTEGKPNLTEFSYDPAAKRPLRINYPEPGSNRRIEKSFKDLDHYHNWSKQNFGVDDPPNKRLRNIQRRNREKALQLRDQNEPTQPRFRVPRAPKPGETQSEGLAPAPKVPRDKPGRLERSKTGPKGDKSQYYVREFLDDYIEVGDVRIPSARYYVDATLNKGIVEADFMLKHDSYEGATQVTRSSQLRGRQEFNRALDHFEAANGPGSVKGMRGSWGAGDNLEGFNKNFHKELMAGKEWDQAIADAARDTFTGRWSMDRGLTEVRIVDDSGYDADAVSFNKIEVLFVKPSVGSEVGGRPTPPWTGNRGGPNAGPRSTRHDTEPDVTPGPDPGDTIPDLPAVAPRAPQAPPPRRPDGGGGGGQGPGGGGGRRQGFRALSASEADGINPAAASRQARWSVSRINEQRSYEEAWAETGHPGPAPPYGFIDYDGNRIVALNRGVDENAVTQIRRGVRRAAPLPRGRRRRDTTQEYPAVEARRRHEAVTRPYPAVEARRRRHEAVTRPYPAVEARRREEATTQVRPVVQPAGQRTPPAPRTGAERPRQRSRRASQETTQQMRPLEARTDTQRTTAVRRRPEASRTSPAAGAQPRAAPRGSAPAPTRGPIGRRSGRREQARPAPRPEAPPQPARPARPRAQAPEPAPSAPPARTRGHGKGASRRDLPARQSRTDVTPEPRLPRGVAGIQDWGINVVRWGGGIDGAHHRMNEIRTNPDKVRFEMTSQPGRWVTPRLARATQEYYHKEIARLEKLGKRNRTAEARIELMKEVERLLEPRSLLERVRDLGRDLSRRRKKKKANKQ